MSVVSDLIGDELTAALTPHQYEIVRVAAEDAPVGLRKVADEIRAAGDKLERPVAVLLNRIDRGVHTDRQRDHDRSAAARTPERMPTIEAAMRLYSARLVDLERHTRDTLSDTQRQENAIDYAISEAPRISLALPAGSSISDVEDELRRRVDASNRRAPETEDEARARRLLQARCWALVQECMYDPRIAAMFHALLDGCIDPAKPTDDEAGNARLALLDEISALGVVPRSEFRVSSDDLEPVGQALGVNHDDDEDLVW